MKRISILIVVLLASAAFSRADTVKLTSGFGQIYPNFVAPGFSFVFRGGRYGLSIPSAPDDFAGSLVNCIPCNGPAGGELFDASWTGDPLSGVIRFDAVSFVSSLGRKGVLMVQYRARADVELIRNPDASNPLIFIWGNPSQLWYITAQFVPDSSGIPGLYDFAGANLSSTPTSPVPESATVILVGTGAWPILVGVRRRSLLRKNAASLADGSMKRTGGERL